MQAGSKREMNAKSDKFQGNIHKRGKVQDDTQVRHRAVERAIAWEISSSTVWSLQKSSKSLSVGPVMLGFFLFVVVGSGMQGQ